MRKQIRYRGFIIKEENGKLNIYKNRKCVSMIHAIMSTGHEAAKSKIDKVNSFHFSWGVINVICNLWIYR